MAKKEVDITKLGPQGYRQLQEANDAEYVKNDPSLAKFLGSLKPLGHNMDPYANATKEIDIPSIGRTPWGESMFDEPNTTISGLEHLQDIRANNQPWYAKIAAGVGKSIVTAATTFADGVVGTLAGIGNVLLNADKINNLEDVGDKFINNPFSTAMQAINDWSETALPNYYTTKEQEEPWYDNIFTANFIGDKFIKNIGFTIGAAYSGRLAAGVLGKALGLRKLRNAFKGVVNAASGKELKTMSEIAKAYKTGDAFMDGVKLTEDLGKAARKLRNADYGLRALGALNAAMGEGRIEAITNSKQWFDYHKQLLDDDKNQTISQIESQLFQEHPEWFSLQDRGDGVAIRVLSSSEGQRELYRRSQDINNKYNEALAKLGSDRAKMANRIFASNVALLSATNLFAYGKFLSGGYNAGRQAKNAVIGSMEEGFSANKSLANKELLKAVAVPFSEMNEEMAQSAIAESTGQKYASELNNFYGKKIDPDAESETIDWINAIGKGISNTYGNLDNWEDGFLGFITGGLGMPHISRRTDESGNKKLNLTLEGELWEGLRNYRKINKENNDIANAMNERIKDPEFLNYYQGLIRHNAYQNDMNSSIDKGDKFSFKNAEHSQFVSDAIMFDKAGRLQDLYDTIDEAGNVSLDDVDSIREQTLKRNGSKSIYDGWTDEAIVESINKKASEAREKLNKYVEISNNLKTLYGDNISSDNLEELTWMMTQVDDWENRTKDIMKDIKSTVSSKAKEIKDRFGVDISDELGNLESMVMQVSDKDNVIDKINSIIYDKNLSVEEGRKRIEELIKAKTIERSDSGLKLGKEINHIRSIAKQRRETLTSKLKEAERGFDRVRGFNEEDKKRNYDNYMNELDRISSEILSYSKQKDHYSDLKIEDLKAQAVEAFNNYMRSSDDIKDMDAALEYAEDFMLNRVLNQLASYEGTRGTSAFEKSEEAFARNRQKNTSSALFSQIVALKEMLSSDDYKLMDPLNIAKLSENFDDLIKLYSARAHFIDKYTALSKNPSLFTEEAQKTLENTRKFIKNKRVNSTLDNIKNVSTVNDLKKSLKDLDKDLADEVLDKFSSISDDNKALVDEYDKLNEYTKSISEVLDTLSPDQSNVTLSLANIIDGIYEDVNSFDEMKSALNEAKSQVPEEIASALNDVMEKAEKNNKSRKLAKSKDKNKPRQEPRKAEKKPKKKSKIKFSLNNYDIDKDESLKNGDAETEGTEDTPKTGTKANQETDTKNTPVSAPVSPVGDETDTKKTSKSGNAQVQSIEEADTDTLKDIANGEVPSDIPDKYKDKAKTLAKKIVKNREMPKGDEQAVGTNSEDNNPIAKRDTIASHFRSWYHTKYRFDELKQRDIRRAVRYDSPVVDALDELGAFDFVDNGYLGDLFNDDPNIPIYYVKSKDKRLNNVIILAIKVTPEISSSVDTTKSFIAQDGNRYQAVGALGVDTRNVKLKNDYNRLNNSINSEYNQYLSDNKDTQSDYFVYPKATNKINHIYSGRMVKTTNQDAPRQKPLKEVLGNTSAMPILGVYYGSSNIPRVPMLGSDEEIVPLNSNNANPRDGSVWLMSKEADGRWYAKALQVRRFTADEYDIDKHEDTPIVKAIAKDILDLVDPNKSEYDRSIAKYDLMNILYFPEGINILFNGDVVSIQGFKNDIGSGLSVKDKAQALLDALQDESLNLRFQVDPSSLSERSYVKDLLDSDILTTDLAMTHNVNASFDLQNIDSNGNAIREDTNPKGHIGTRGINNEVQSRTTYVNGTKYSTTSDGVYDDKKNRIDNRDTLDEIELMQSIEDGKISPVEGNDRLYLGVYSSTGNKFGISGGHVFIGDKLDEMLKAANTKKDKADRKRDMSDVYNTLISGTSAEYIELSNETGMGISKSTETPETPSSPDEFKENDKVYYKTSSSEEVGKVVKIGDKMVMVEREDGRKAWYMPSLLSKQSTSEKSTEKKPTKKKEVPSGGKEYSADDVLNLFGGNDTSEETDTKSDEDTNDNTDIPMASEDTMFSSGEQDDYAALAAQIGLTVGKGDNTDSTETPVEKPAPKKDTPLAISGVFDKSNTPSLKDLENRSTNFNSLVRNRENRETIKSLGFSTVGEFTDYVKNKDNELPDISTINSEESFKGLLDIITNCRKR